MWICVSGPPLPRPWPVPGCALGGGQSHPRKGGSHLLAGPAVLASMPILLTHPQFAAHTVYRTQLCHLFWLKPTKMIKMYQRELHVRGREGNDSTLPGSHLLQPHQHAWSSLSSQWCTLCDLQKVPPCAPDLKHIKSNCCYSLSNGKTYRCHQFPVFHSVLIPTAIPAIPVKPLME